MNVEDLRSSPRSRQLSCQKVVEKYSALVTSTGHEIARQMQSPIEFDDLLSWGFQGLLEAHERYIAATEVTFATYAYYRIRGAMYDGLRKTGWAVRGTAIQIRDSIAINEHLENRTHTHASTPPAATLEESVDRATSMVGECVTICLLQGAQLDRVATAVPPAQTEAIEQRDLNLALNAAVAKLREDEREILIRYHVDEQSMTEIAQIMNISTSWVSRIHGNAINALREILYEQDEPWESYLTRS